MFRYSGNSQNQCKILNMILHDIMAMFWNDSIHGFCKISHFENRNAVFCNLCCVKARLRRHTRSY